MERKSHHSLRYEWVQFYLYADGEILLPCWIRRGFLGECCHSSCSAQEADGAVNIQQETTSFNSCLSNSKSLTCILQRQEGHNVWTVLTLHKAIKWSPISAPCLESCDRAWHTWTERSWWGWLSSWVMCRLDGSHFLFQTSSAPPATGNADGTNKKNKLFSAGSPWWDHQGNCAEHKQILRSSF